MEIKTLARCSTKEILRVFNDSFSDYFIPFKLSKNQLILKMLADKTDLNLSVGVFENGKLIAFILHGLDHIEDQKIVYNGGTGVIPSKRGSGLTKQMYRYILPHLKEQKITKLVLEVIVDNIQAIKSYEHAGYLTKRRLLCFKGKVNKEPQHTSHQIKTLNEYDWDIMETFWDIKPTWQNSKTTMNLLKKQHVSIGVYEGNCLLGYVIYDPKTNRLQQIAVLKSHRQQGIATALMAHLKRNYGTDLSIINVDKSSENMIGFLNTMGLRINLEQLEMELKLS